MENKVELYNSKRIMPAPGIIRIVKGIRYQAENPMTHEKVWVGDGEILYDNPNPKNKPLFILNLKDI